MTRFAAFLRGVNVGGHVVTKDTLQKTFEDLGFEEVTTFRQSGNMIFEGGRLKPEQARTRVENALRRRVGYDVGVFIRTFEDLTKMLKSAPKGPGREGTSLLVTLLPSPTAKFPLPIPTTIPNSTALIVSASGAEVFSQTHGGGEGALPNPFLESKLKVKATTRNVNVIREIVERYGRR